MKVSIKTQEHHVASTKSKIARKKDEYLSTVVQVFTLAKWFGIASYGGNLAFCWAVLILIMLSALETGAIWKLAKQMADANTSSASLIPRMAGSIFYGNALFSLILSWKFLSSWKHLSVQWVNTENTEGMYFLPDQRIRRRVIFVTSMVAIFACVEHIMSMISATGFDIPPDEYFDRYILSSHGFLLQPHEYTLWLAIPVFILSKLATVLWNFQDLIIILISMGLTSRYHRLNVHMSRIVKAESRSRDIKKFGTEVYAHLQTWRRLREAYVRQSALVRNVNERIGSLILLSNLNNFYFICLQLFNGLNQNHGSLLYSIYYFFSLGWLLFRASSVVLAAADVNIHSRRALAYLYRCPVYNIEIKRLKNQLTYDCVALSGMGFFSLDRQLLLEVAAAILKYELVLLQYDTH